jgi:cytochrome c biogenesis protein CcmG, thiol:disulfide interchange protein DsbE
MPRRPIVLALLVAAVTTLAVIGFVRVSGGAGLVADSSGAPADGHAAVDRPAPAISGTTLDGTAFDLAAYAGKPVVINFWGPSCVPCRDEFPLLESKVSQHAAEGLTVVGVLTDDPAGPARDFIATYGATWPTVDDPSKAIKAAYRVAARPQTYFVDRTGILRSIQVGELTDADFERQYARIAQ